MRLKKVGYFLGLLLVITIVACVTNPRFVHAAEIYQVDYSVLDTKTNQVASINESFVKPAQVKLLSNKYQVTFEIRLDGPLTTSNFAQLLFNNQVPQIKLIKRFLNENVYQVILLTNQLQEPLNGVVKLAGQNQSYDFKLKFAPNNVPSLTSKSQITESLKKSQVPNKQTAIRAPKKTDGLVKQPQATVTKRQQSDLQAHISSNTTNNIEHRAHQVPKISKHLSSAKNDIVAKK